MVIQDILEVKRKYRLMDGKNISGNNKIIRILIIVIILFNAIISDKFDFWSSFKIANKIQLVQLNLNSIMR